MYMVYWTESTASTESAASQEAGGGPRSRSFASDQMVAAMQFMETLRVRQRAGKGVAFIVMASENPHSVGHPGVADPSPDYNWKKRRP